MLTLIAGAEDKDLKAAYQEMYDGCQKNPAEKQWYAPWTIENGGGNTVGDLGFKGITADGMVEIGYGIDEAYWGRGYATEAVIEAVKWASEQKGVTRIEAETDPDNAASQRVLQKAGFLPLGVMGEEGPRFLWREKK